MAVFGLPGGAELWVLLIVVILGVGIPAWAMYRIAGRVGYPPSAQFGWAAAYAVAGWLALLVFSSSEWPTRSPAADRTGDST